MAIRKATPFDLTLMICTMAIWALAFIAMKVAVPETGPYWLATARNAFGFVAVLPFLIWAGLKLPKNTMQWALIMVITLLNTTTPIILISWAELTLSAGVASLLMGIGPFLALFIGHFTTTDERFTFLKLIAVLMGFSGIVSIVGFDAFLQLDISHIMAEAALILASLMYVIAGFTVRRIDLPPISLTALSLFLGTLILTPFSMIVSGPVPVNISPQAFWWLVFVGVFGTGLGFMSRYHLIGKIGYSMFSIGINLIPVFGVIFGSLILGEIITWRTALALALIVGGLFVARLGSRSSGHSLQGERH